MSREDWVVLFEAQANSVLSVREFCLQHNLNQKTFYNKRYQMGFSAVNKATKNKTTALCESQKKDVPQLPSSFVRLAAVDNNTIAELTHQPSSQTSSHHPEIKLSLGKLTLQLQGEVSARWLASLMKELV